MVIIFDLHKAKNKNKIFLLEKQTIFIIFVNGI